MVTVDVQVAGRLDLEVDQPVARDLVEHVVEEADAGGELRLPGAVDIDAHPDLRLLRVAADVGGAMVHLYRLVFNAFSICTFSSGVPTVRRRQFASSGCRPSTFFTSTPCAFMPAKTRFASGTRTRIMLASLGKGSQPGSWCSRRCKASRCSRITAAWRANSSACSSANSVASALSTLTLYGGRTLSISWISAFAPAR